MKYKITNYPKLRSLEDYSTTITSVAAQLIKQSGIVSVYQVGGVGSPGISDIDLIVVCENDQLVDLNPKLDCEGFDQYLFTHSLLGHSEKHFIEAQKYSLYHNYKLIEGKDLLQDSIVLPTFEETTELKLQIALEFLWANYFVRTTEIKFRILSLRNLLLSVHAIRYDLEFLNIKEGNLFDSVQQIIDWRTDWFNSTPSDGQISQWFENFCSALEQCLSDLPNSKKIYIPTEAKSKFARHISWEQGESLKCKHSGIVTPPPPLFDIKKWGKVLQRTNQFTFTIPVARESNSDFLPNRFQFYKAAKKYNKQFLPHFGVPASSIPSNII